MMGLIMLGIVLIASIAYFIWSKLQASSKSDEANRNISQESSWRFTNVKDIIADRIITLDNLAISCWCMDSVNIDLLSKDEINNLIIAATPSIAGIEEPYKIISIQKPYEITPYIADLMEKYKASYDEIHKKIILQEIAALNDLGSRNDIANRKSYLVYWGENNKKFDLKRRNFEKCWDSAGINLELLDEKELVRLCNLIFNPSYSGDINADFYPTVTQLEN